MTIELAGSIDVASMWQPFDLAIQIDRSFDQMEDVLIFLATRLIDC
jgi:hypothetical protein